MESAFATRDDFSVECLSFRALKKSWQKSVQQIVIISFTLPDTNSENDKSKSNFFPLVYSYSTKYPLAISCIPGTVLLLRMPEWKTWPPSCSVSKH